MLRLSNKILLLILSSIIKIEYFQIYFFHSGLRDGKEMDSETLSLVGEEDRYDFDLVSFNYSSVSPGENRSTFTSLQLGTSKVEQGGVYTLVVTRDEETHQLRSVLFPLTSPNTVHMLWQVPQYVIITVSEVMFSVTGSSKMYNFQHPITVSTTFVAPSPEMGEIRSVKQETDVYTLLITDKTH